MPLFNLHFEVITNNEQHEGKTCDWIFKDTPSACKLAVIEFDDQGLCFTPKRLFDIEDELKILEKENPIILVFAHGWRHNANKLDENLIRFQEVLGVTAKQQNESGRKRPVLGVFLGWRGLSTHGNDAWEYLSFWDRMQAAERVAHGSARELLGRLKAFREWFRSKTSPGNSDYHRP